MASSQMISGCPSLYAYVVQDGMAIVTCASLMLRQGVHPKIVSEMLGHSTVAITLDIYSHVTPDLQEAAAKKLDEILPEGVSLT